MLAPQKKKKSSVKILVSGGKNLNLSCGELSRSRPLSFSLACPLSLALSLCVRLPLFWPGFLWEIALCRFLDRSALAVAACHTLTSSQKTQFAVALLPVHAAPCVYVWIPHFIEARLQLPGSISDLLPLTLIYRYQNNRSSIAATEYVNSPPSCFVFNIFLCR